MARAAVAALGVAAAGLRDGVGGWVQGTALQYLDWRGGWGEGTALRCLDWRGGMGCGWGRGSATAQ